SSCVAAEFVPLPARTRGAGTNSAPIGGMGRQPLTTTSELVAPRPARSVHRTSWARRYEFAAASTPLRPAPSPSRVRPRPGVGVAGCPLLQPVRVRVRAEVVLPGGVRAVPGTNSARGHELGVGVRRTLGRGPRPRPRLRLRPRPYPHRPHPSNDEGRPAVRDGLCWTCRYADAGVSVLRDVETALDRLGQAAGHADLTAADADGHEVGDLRLPLRAAGAGVAARELALGDGHRCLLGLVMRAGPSGLRLALGCV